MGRKIPECLAVCVAGLIGVCPADAEPFDQCGTFVQGVECILFQPDTGGPPVQAEMPPPPVGTRGRLRGDQQSCASFCFAPCVFTAVFTDCTPVCRPDFDGNGILTPADIFAFLNAWFAGNITADFDQSGALGVQDIFDFINAWFAGC